MIRYDPSKQYIVEQAERRTSEAIRGAERRRIGQSGSDRSEGNERSQLKRSEENGENEVYQEAQSIVEREEWHTERIADHSDKIISA